MQALLFALACFTYFTIVLGSWVRNAGAGLSCPDWPLCHGKLIPPMEYRIMLEYFHRLAAAFVSILLLVLLIRVFSQKKYRDRIGKWMGLATGLLIVQIILGKLTVDKLLQWEVVATHLGVAVLFLSSILIALFSCNRMYLEEQQGGTNITRLPSWLQPAFFLLLGFVYLQILLGGSVSSHYAGLACPDFPTCHGEWWPKMEGQIAIQMVHRLMALVLTFDIGLIYFFIFMFKVEAFKKLIKYVAILLGVQWTLAIAMILFGVQNNMTIPPHFSVAHLAVGVAIYVLLLNGVYEIRSSNLSQSNKA